MNSIDNLREYVLTAPSICSTTRAILVGYIDNIEREVADMVSLPVDADGVPIHVGDVLDPPADCDDYVPMQVVRLMYDGYEQEWFFDGDVGGFCGLVGEHMDVAGWTHHHAPTVEDVLREFAAQVTNGQHIHGAIEIEQAIAECAAKLQLKEG